MNYIIKNAKIVNEGSITESPLLLKEGRISFDTSDCDGAEVIDATGCYLIPGIIDTHVHFRDGGDGSNPAGDFHSESRAAVAGGTTSVVDMPNTVPQTTTQEALEQKERMAAEKSMVNYGFMVGATNENIEWLLALEPTRYAAIKLFLGSSTGNMLVNNDEKLEKLFKEARKLIVAHCEEEAVVQANLKNFKLEYQGTEKETAALHPQIRNTEACYLSTYKAIERARRLGTRLHVAHLSTATELNLLSNKPLEEKNITAEVTPNHLWFDDRDYEKLGNKIKCNPAIKSNDDRLALWAALYDGLIDTIGTDHAPHPLEAKQKPYFDAPSGIPSIQHSLQMMMEPFFNPESRDDTEAIQTWMPLIVAKMSHNPALLFGIEKRGFIREGYWGDVVLVREEPHPHPIAKEELRYKCGWSPLEGETLHTRIEKVFINGKLVAEGGELTGGNAAKALQFEK